MLPFSTARKQPANSAYPAIVPKKAGERLITFSTGPAAESRRQSGYGVHCIHSANPPEDRESSGQGHTINKAYTHGGRQHFTVHINHRLITHRPARHP